MKIVQRRYLISKGGYATSADWQAALRDVEAAISAITWPPGGTPGEFVIRPESGKKRGQGNGVSPIKQAFLQSLARSEWATTDHINPDRFDAVRFLDDGRFLAVEWETGNISSSHRALNRMLLAHLGNDLLGGMLVLPSRRLYKYLTDRVGNYEELSRYFPVWEAQEWEEGAVLVIAIEHDREDPSTPRIEKGTDGRALL